VSEWLRGVTAWQSGEVQKEHTMVKKKLPVHFSSVQDRFPKVMEALEELG
jgi:hypothetical protein